LSVLALICIGYKPTKIFIANKFDIINISLHL
jgi:hypothetical protein